MPPALRGLAPSGSLRATYGPFPSLGEPGTLIEMPSRSYTEPMDDKTYRSFTDRQRILADCWYSRNHNGYVRQRHLQQLVNVEEQFVIPYVLAALGDYVVEIVSELEAASVRWVQGGSWHQHHYRQFASYNVDFMGLMRQRATSYRHCYYTNSYRGASAGVDRRGRPLYPAFVALDRLDEGSGYPPLQFRLPSTQT